MVKFALVFKKTNDPDDYITISRYKLVNLYNVVSLYYIIIMNSINII